jgi:simple sugar transport system ATP-binding protein
VPGGRIVGIAGISGNGQADLMKAISGEVLLEKGSVKILGQNAGDLSVKHRRALGLRYVPEERMGHGSVPEMSLESNTLLTSNLFLSKGFMRNKMIQRFTEHIVREFKVKCPSTKAHAGSLSGGNLQKFIVGREMLHNPKVLVINQPTWGVDVGAAALIRNAIIEERTAGAAVLVVSEEIDELFEICDDLVVMSKGQISPQVKASEITVDQVGRWMSGLWTEDAETNGRKE